MTPQLDHYCRDCHHMTESVEGKCKWCRSTYIGSMPEKGSLCESERYPSRPQVAEPDVLRQTQYPISHRLRRGFAILGGGEI